MDPTATADQDATTTRRRGGLIAATCLSGLLAAGVGAGPAGAAPHAVTEVPQPLRATALASAALGVAAEGRMTLAVDPSIAEDVQVAFDSLLGRDPTASERRAFEAHLAEGGRPDDMTMLLAGSAEGRQRLVAHYYGPYLDRTGDPEGIAYWTDRLIQGVSPARFQAQVLSSNEAYRNAGGTDQAWVASLYRHPLLLDRAPDRAGLDHWVEYLEDHSRSQVARRFVTSAEAERLTGRYAWTLLFDEEPSGLAWREATLLYRDLGQGHDLWLLLGQLLGQSMHAS